MSAAKGSLLTAVVVGARQPPARAALLRSLLQTTPQPEWCCPQRDFHPVKGRSGPAPAFGEFVLRRHHSETAFAALRGWHAENERCFATTPLLPGKEACFRLARPMQ